MNDVLNAADAHPAMADNIGYESGQVTSSYKLIHYREDRLQRQVQPIEEHRNLELRVAFC